MFVSNEGEVVVVSNKAGEKRDGTAVSFVDKGIREWMKEDTWLWCKHQVRSRHHVQVVLIAGHTVDTVIHAL